jgi:predicted MFS family arabinose efflux permease
MGESRAVLSLAILLSFRMLGLFMIYPVFAIYAKTFHYATPTLIGITLGIYGLSQGLLQLPLSALSDYLGRKPVIIGGLVILAFGSIVCAVTHNIYLLAMGRALQGAGAIGSTIMAAAADLTSLQTRTKAMAVLGSTIGLSFALALILGPLINNWFQLSGIFWFTAACALLGIIIVCFSVPKIPKHPINQTPALPNGIKHIIFKGDISKLNFSIFLLHALFTASFTTIPLLLANFDVLSSAQWKIYLPILMGAFLICMPIIILAERKKYVKQTLLISIIFMALSELGFYFSSQKIFLLSALLLFFITFTLLEAFLPSLVSKLVSPHQRGKALGIFATFQFLGIFVGGAAGGLLQTHYHRLSVFYYAAVMCLIWALFIMKMKQPATFNEKNSEFHSNPSTF